jgi:uncharacterized protein
MTSETANSTAIASLFAEAPFSTRSFIWLRWKLTPYRRIASILPRRGRVLDLGSGHGLLSLALSMDSPEREIIGVDHDRERVRFATAAIARHDSVSKPRFEIGDLVKSIESIAAGSLAGIAMIDILHYFDTDSQIALLHGAARALESGGMLAVREVDSEGGGVAVWNRAYENVATRIGFTQSARSQLEFRSVAGWTKMIASAGFSVQSEPCGSKLFSDVLFVGKRSS